MQQELAHFFERLVILAKLMAVKRTTPHVKTQPQFTAKLNDIYGVAMLTTDTNAESLDS